MYTLLSFSETYFHIFISLGLFLESGRHFLKVGRFLMQRGEQWAILERGRRTQKKVRYEFFGTDLLPQQKQESNSEAVIRQKDGCRLPRRLPDRYNSKGRKKKSNERHVHRPSHLRKQPFHTYTPNATPATRTSLGIYGDRIRA